MIPPKASDQDLNSVDVDILDIDILDIDRKIRISISNLIPHKQQFIDQISMINELMQIDSLRYNIKNDLINLKNDLEEKISILHCWNFYTLATISILYKYLELINISVTVDIFNQSLLIDDINTQKQILIDKFIRIIDFLLPQYKSLYMYNLECLQHITCYNCNNDSFDKCDDIYICKKCYVESFNMIAINKKLNRKIYAKPIMAPYGNVPT